MDQHASAWIGWVSPLLACVALSGCFSVDSAVFLNRGYTDDDLVDEAALEGRWARADDVDERSITDPLPQPALVIERGDASAGCYKVSFFERFVEDWLIARPASSAKLCAFRVSGQTFLDITRWPEGIDFESMTVTWHWFAAADVSSDELRLRLLHPFLVGEYLREHPLDLPHTKLDYGGDAQIVITAAPRDIQLFLLLHLGLNDLMDEEYVLRKLPPAEPGDDSAGETPVGESGAQVAPQER
jgi:hypothetical protein